MTSSFKLLIGRRKFWAFLVVKISLSKDFVSILLIGDVRGREGWDPIQTSFDIPGVQFNLNEKKELRQNQMGEGE